MIWIVFAVAVVGLLALDLGVLRHRQREVTLREGLVWSAVWIALALAFNAAVWMWRGTDAAAEFLTGYLIEKALSIDHLFVFLLIFSAFRIPAQRHHTVLFWGVIGAFAMRLVLIALGLTLVERFEWLLYLFGAFLVVTGIRTALRRDREAPVGQHFIVRALGRVLPVTHDDAGGRFVVRRGGRLHATPLLVVLLLVEATDFVFAVDSIPAILAITRDPMIVYTSNVFALLGMRALYFAIAGILPFFHYLHYAFGGILAFAGIRMLVADFVDIPVPAALGVIAALLLGAMVASVVRPEERQIETLVEQGAQSGAFEIGEARLVGRVLDMGDRRVGSVMTPRPDVVWLDAADDAGAVAAKIRRARDPVVPLARGSLDDVVGMVAITDIAAGRLTGDRLDLTALARPALVLPDSLDPLEVVARLRDERADVALVADEHGVVMGVVSVRDVAEALLCEDAGGAGIVRERDGAWRVEGTVSLHDLVEGLDLEPPTAEERALYETVGGLAMGRLGRIPAPGDRFVWRNLAFEVLTARRYRAAALRVRRQDARIEAA